MAKPSKPTTKTKTKAAGSKASGDKRAVAKMSASKKPVAKALVAKSRGTKSPVAKADAPKGEAQFAALPWRHRPDGAVEVLVITSRETRRWVLPKGWPMKAMTPAQAAAREAYEEAGVIGEADPDPIGDYGYDKRLRDGALQGVRVQVFAMEVVAEQLAWPEKDQREKLWTTREAAADMVDEPELKALIRGFEP